jgi:hypothetical protein
VARRLVLFPDEFAALDGGPKQPMGGGIVDLPVPVSQPESTAVPPDHASPEWQFEVNEGIKRELRQRGITSSGPLRASATIGIKPWGDV